MRRVPLPVMKLSDDSPAGAMEQILCFGRMVERFSTGIYGMEYSSFWVSIKPLALMAPTVRHRNVKNAIDFFIAGYILVA